MSIILSLVIFGGGFVAGMIALSVLQAGIRYDLEIEISELKSALVRCEKWYTKKESRINFPIKYIKRAMQFNSDIS